MPRPPSSKRWITLVVALVASRWLSAAPVEATATNHTPYDPYLGPVFKVLSEVGTESPDLERVRALMREARSFEYRMEDPLRPVAPKETARRRVGDCKAKALWLCKEMNDASVLYVIGKVSPDSLINHAWLQWRKGERLYVLDATNHCEPLCADQLDYQSYIPLYAFGKNGTMRFRPKLASSELPAGGNKPLPVSGLKR